MHRTNLRKVGGSVMLAIPPALLELVQLRPGSTVDIGVESGRIVVEPHARPRYRLDELLAQCDPGARRTKQGAQWVRGKRVGRELI